MAHRQHQPHCGEGRLKKIETPQGGNLAGSLYLTLEYVKENYSMDYTEILKAIKEVLMKTPAWRLIWLSMVALLWALVWKLPDILNALK